MPPDSGRARGSTWGKRLHAKLPKPVSREQIRAKGEDDFSSQHRVSLLGSIHSCLTFSDMQEPVIFGTSNYAG